jgi:DNA-directed RNA polymerase I subunit RPA2
MNMTYGAPMVAKICRQIGGGPVQTITRNLGNMPIMVKTGRCHLQHLNGEQLIARKEERTEQGGYFIINGLEKIMRMIILPRRNHVHTHARFLLQP